MNASPFTVSQSALVRRINRALAPELTRLRKTRGDRWRGDLGDYYVVDDLQNRIIAPHVDPEAFGRELGVLSKHERVAA